MEGLLRAHPLAELIREISAAGVSGALRLARERAKAAIYFDDGALVFAASNLRAHRLSASLKGSRILNEAQIAKLPRTESDEELANTLVQRGLLTSETLAKIRGNQVSDVLRVTLLWTEGTWEFDPRVRLADDVRVRVEVSRLLLECARHLPASFLASRFDGTNGTFSQAENNGNTANLLPAEAFVFSRATAPVTLAELTALSGLGEEESLRAMYALLLSGHLRLSNWSRTFISGISDAPRVKQSQRRPAAVSETPNAATEEIDEASELQALFARLQNATDHYEVLNLGRLASAEEIKSAYHTLARRYHPDRFHQSAPDLRSRVDSAFARIAQAYETLGDQSLRGVYDAKRASKPSRAGAHKPLTAGESPNGGSRISPGSEANRAESSFQRGVAALKQNRREEAIRFLAEAAMLAPREARYRAHYGHALIGQANTRRIAEAELNAALALEPDNVAYRIMLAELYKQLGLRRRAEGELERALATDPKNTAARTMLSSLKR
ncbi:MAG TPA: DUF4388 domain-containing protein [Pyrinomonadaceae bacterium]|nr:DUF4388 domain-containing protein [Pyrinomonadaceae bacterium]